MSASLKILHLVGGNEISCQITGNGISQVLKIEPLLGEHAPIHVGWNEQSPFQERALLFQIILLLL